jgi:hypothetical protein
MNWGKGIAIFIAAFMVFILSMVYRASQTETDLYAPDYYEQEISYQTKIDALANGNPFAEFINLENKEGSIYFSFPDILSANYTGTVKFYRPDNAKLDRSFPLELNENGMQYLDGKEFVPGGYSVSFIWHTQGQDFQVDKNLYIP